jgi:putative FmdB family regulatory protein
VPTYDYQCRSCGKIIEVVHSMLEDGPTACDRCGGELRRLVSQSGIIFKGSGFYKTDSRSSSSSTVADSSGSSAPSGGDGAAAPAPTDGGSKAKDAKPTTPSGGGAASD